MWVPYIEPFEGLVLMEAQNLRAIRSTRLIRCISQVQILRFHFACLGVLIGFSSDGSVG